MTAPAAPTTHAPEDVDVLIVGAGISGLGAAYHLQQHCPGKRFVILESQAGHGGTWRTHRYPGIRSDSDLFTFGYRFKPWMGKPIASGAEIQQYLGEVIDENRLAPHIRYGHAVVSAEWSSARQRWIVQARHGDHTVTVQARFLWMCQGYYRHAGGYTPQWPGMEDFKGRIVHPQDWPDDLDLAGKQVVVIGSGATAATLIPAIADTCASVTMLQRSPTFFITGRNANELADTLRQLDIPERMDTRDRAPQGAVRPGRLHPALHGRARGRAQGTAGRRARRARARTGNRGRDALQPELPAVAAAHCLRARRRPVQGDSRRQGQGGDRPDRALHRQRHPAEIRPRAAGRHRGQRDRVQPQRDGRHRLRHRRPAAGLCQHGDMARCDVQRRAQPGLGLRLLSRQLDAACRPDRRLRLPAAAAHGRQAGCRRDADAASRGSGHGARPWIEPQNFNPGYLARGMHLLPRQGAHEPWLHKQDYGVEKDELPRVDLDDATLVYR